MKNIYDIGKKLITLNEIQNYYKIYQYKELVELIDTLLDEGKIVPVKASKTNGMVPPLFNKYRIIIKKQNVSELTDEINHYFPFSFNREYYLNNINKYQEDKIYIDKFIHFYRNRKEELSYPMSINERSFSIFNEEKFLKNARGLTILNNLGFNIDFLNIYLTPEPFVYYSSNKKEPQTVLIVENKDTWYTLRRLMIEGQNRFFGVWIDTIIYGAGKGIEKSLEEYEYNVEDYLKDPDKILYWGDIDYEGILIYERLKLRYKDVFSISLFEEAYSKMLEYSEVSSLPKMRDKQNKNVSSLFLNELNAYKSSIMKLLEDGFYIPQELINYRILKGV